MDTWRVINRSISALYRSNQAAMGRLLEPLGLGHGHYPYMIAVCKHPGISQDKLTCQLLINKSSVARAIAQLEKGGFLNRFTDPADRRCYRLYPTDKGKAALGEIFAQMDIIYEVLTRGLTDAETEQAAVLLTKMAANIEEIRNLPYYKEKK